MVAFLALWMLRMAAAMSALIHWWGMCRPESPPTPAPLVSPSPPIGREEETISIRVASADVVAVGGRSLLVPAFDEDSRSRLLLLRLSSALWERASTMLMMTQSVHNPNDGKWCPSKCCCRVMSSSLPIIWRNCVSLNAISLLFIPRPVTIIVMSHNRARELFLNAYTSSYKQRRALSRELFSCETHARPNIGGFFNSLPHDWASSTALHQEHDSHNPDCVAFCDCDLCAPR